MIELLKSQPQRYHDQITTLLGREVIHMAVMLELDFANTPLRICNRNIPFTDLQTGRTWDAGSHLLVGLPNISNSKDSLAPFRQYQLAFPTTEIDEDNWVGQLIDEVADVANYRRRVAKLALQFFDGDAPAGYPVVVDSGFMDKMSLSMPRGGAIISLTTESLMARKKVPVYGMQTWQDQMQRQPGDQGMEFVVDADVLKTWTDW